MKHSLAVASFLLASAAAFAANTYKYAGGLQFSYPDSWTREEMPNGLVRLFPEGKTNAGFYAVTVKSGDVSQMDQSLMQSMGLQKISPSSATLQNDDTRHIHAWQVQNKQGDSGTVLFGSAVVAENKTMVMFAVDDSSQVDARRESLASIVNSMAYKPVAPKPVAPKPANPGYEILQPDQYDVRLSIRYGFKTFVAGTIHNNTGRHFQHAAVYVDLTDRNSQVLLSTVLYVKDLKPGKSGRLYGEYAKHATKYVVTRVEVLP